MKSCFSNVIIQGLVTVVPGQTILLDDEKEYYQKDLSKIDRLKSTVGLYQRTCAPKNVTAADMCEQAAHKLLDDLNVDRETIDAIIFVSDAADYKCPPTACVLQGKLNLSVDCMSFDVTHGCSGYVYGLNIASSLIQSGGCKKILLLAGDTKTHTINIKDRISAPLFGDGGTATLLEYTENEENSYYLLGTEGRKYDNIMIPAGGARMPYDEETSKEYVDEYGNIRSANNFYMNGKNVFDFTMNRVPKAILETFEWAKISPDKIDYAIFHQANKSILKNISMRVGIKDFDKRVPCGALKKYGNLAVASIPSAISEALSDTTYIDNKKILVAGFGVGLSWGIGILNFRHVYCPKVTIYKE